eukprot:TRINITY_DN3573_c0_g1_i1.p2 TRINITY_DN3573_c0_g1~~TRINITY_DN3573_c0_g1_i1.p2  ORF type:complete len:103 (+),score=35.06 TRINITY_DN3573_c0_g1_i1:645-953(+)
MQEAQLAMEKMNGRLACGRPLVVRFSSEKNFVEATNPSKAAGVTRKSAIVSSSLGQMSRSAKIAAIKNKLKAMEEENCSTKKPRPADGGAICSYNDNQSSSN